MGNIPEKYLYICNTKSLWGLIMKYTIEISPEKAGQLLELSTDFKCDLEEVVARTNSLLSPEGIYRVYETAQLSKTSFTISGKEFHCGAKVCQALEGSKAIAVLLATIGEGVNTLIGQYNKEYDFLKAYWCDKLANWTLDQVIEQMKAEIARNAEKDGWKTTSNWGPGYCGWNITEQASLLELLPAEELRVSLSPSMLMHPVKSLSGVMGIGRHVRYKKSGCADCNLSHCTYRSLKW